MHLHIHKDITDDLDHGKIFYISQLLQIELFCIAIIFVPNNVIMMCCTPNHPSSMFGAPML